MPRFANTPIGEFKTTPRWSMILWNSDHPLKSQAWRRASHRSSNSAIREAGMIRLPSNPLP